MFGYFCKFQKFCFCKSPSKQEKKFLDFCTYIRIFENLQSERMTISTGDKVCIFTAFITIVKMFKNQKKFTFTYCT